eukprot:Lithocolla_globosa_v1_NODE_3362_length_1690_cov_5.666055.p2 type:complete len:156 gc:universal NODE_3362_length_1690_cov_5.666055:958-1425(+)
MGPFAASEPEVQAAAGWMLREGVVAGIDWHAYTQLILRPYGWKQGPAEHEAELFEVAEGMQSRIQAVHGKYFQNQHSIDLYLTTGSTSDWLYGDQLRDSQGHRAYGFTLELRPETSNPGFILPPEEIRPSGEEQVPAFLYFCEYVLQHPLRPLVA